jgi:hypothetical protein
MSACDQVAMATVGLLCSRRRAHLRYRSQCSSATGRQTKPMFLCNSVCCIHSTFLFVAFPSLRTRCAAVPAPLCVFAFCLLPRKRRSVCPSRAQAAHSQQQQQQQQRPFRPRRTNNERAELARTHERRAGRFFVCSPPSLFSPVRCLPACRLPLPCFALLCFASSWRSATARSLGSAARGTIR